MESVKKIGIFGGTFDPIHIGHLAIGEIARQEFHLDKVLFIPAGNPPHKDSRTVTSGQHRLNMTKISIEDNNFFDVDPIEIFRDGRSFTIDTLKQLRQVYPLEYIFYFIIGSDSLMEISGWKNASDLLKMCRLIVYKRPGYSEEMINGEAERLSQEFGTKVFFIEGPMLEISSTEIRTRINMGKTVRYIIPQKAQDYIVENSLYTGDKYNG